MAVQALAAYPDHNEAEGNCEIVELKQKYETFNVLVERKCRKL